MDFTNKFYKALQAQVSAFEKSGNPDTIPSYPIYKALEELFKTVGPQWAHRSVLHIRQQQSKARLPMGFSERIVELMRQYYGIDLLNDAELMTFASREIIVSVLSKSAELGLSFDQIVAELRQHPEFGAMRARRIARTETVTAANGAAMINAKESGLELNKKWLSVGDHRTRPHHREVNGKVVGIDEPFNLMGNLMQQPGVRTLDDGQKTPASEVVNCRCTVAFIPLRDANGRIR